MRVDPVKTHFGIMFGDNTGYIASCQYLACMLEHVGRTAEAAHYRERASAMQQRLNVLCWNGRYFTHHVPEDPSRPRDLGVDEARQVSLSNAYSLNRALCQDHCAAIIETYQGIREQLPQGSPGEWYTIYPPFGKGFGDHNGLWQYMNGGVTPIVAGELAHGAFEHGYEHYAVDILRRLFHLGKQHQGLFHGVYVGSIPRPPERSFEPIDIRRYANTDPSGSPTIERGPVPGWTGEGENDLHEVPSGEQRFADIPFLLPDPASNERRGCIGLSTRPGYAPHISIPLDKKAASLYFLHMVSQPGPANVAGVITLHYADGSSYQRYVVRGHNVSGWWFPQDPSNGQQPRITRIAWLGKNDCCPEVGLTAYGLDNPFPDLTIEHVTLTASVEGGFWGVFGLTLCDTPVYFASDPISFGIPNSWGAAAVVYALIEGLAGVVDTSTAFERVALSPRWSAAHVNQARATITYPASHGYLAYQYRPDQQQRVLELTLTGSGEECFCHLLHPQEACHIKAVYSNEQPLTFITTHLAHSCYLDFTVVLPRPHQVQIHY